MAERVRRWRIGRTIFKSEFWWLTLGDDIKGKGLVTLQWIQKDALSEKQLVDCEKQLEAMKQVKHKNVKRLLAAFNDDDIKNGKFMLLVWEYCPSAGQLFDILYYTLTTQGAVARTFIKQIIEGLKASHDANVFYRNLNPQNLLLDNELNLKIVNYELSQILKSSDNATRGYMAPELLSDENYKADAKCDIFSVGVILFILLAGYPPFDVAAKSDKWFKPLMKGRINKFWQAHSHSPIAHNESAKHLLTKMLHPDPLKRINIDQIQRHEWFKEPILQKAELIAEVWEQRRLAEEKRKRDIKKMNCLYSRVKLELFPQNEIECMFGEVYTYLGQDYQTWTDFYDLLQAAIVNKGKGVAEWDNRDRILRGEMKVDRGRSAGGDSVQFKIKIYESRYWKNRYLEALSPKEIVEGNSHQIFIVKITRTKGDSYVFHKLKNKFFLRDCSSILKGLPPWAKKINDEKKVIMLSPREAIYIRDASH